MWLRGNITYKFNKRADLILFCWSTLREKKKKSKFGSKKAHLPYQKKKAHLPHNNNIT